MSKIISLLLLTNFLSFSLAFADDSTLTVQGFARLRKPADKLSVSIGVVSEGKTAEETLKANSTKMQNIIQALKGIELDSSSIQTGSFTIQPIMTSRPDNSPRDWVPTIRGYRVENSTTVQTDKLSLAGAIVDIATKSGANSIDSLVFSLQDPRTWRSEAIQQAADYASEDAITLAAAANVKLGEIRTIELDESSVSAPRMKTAMAFREAMTPIEPADVEVTATVRIVYEIDSH